MSDYIRWLVPLRRAYPPWGHFDDYKAARVVEFCAERKWKVSELTALSIENEEKRTQAEAYIVAQQQEASMEPEWTEQHNDPDEAPPLLCDQPALEVTPECPMLDLRGDE